MDFAFLATGDFSELTDVVALIKQYGPLLVAVIFFLWRDYKREDRLTQRINTLEDQQRDINIPLVSSCTEVITKNTVVMERLEKHLDL